MSVPQSRHFDKKSRNDILMKVRCEKFELTFFQSISQETLETILDKILFYNHPTQ
ncbi:IS66 family element, Orf1 [Streptococcus oralis]|uniref:IS66 family element, Orf1 n=1 Tax=Streptococcus oralis TaxID=1303 RepID=A0A139PF57_STROR|nr:IS66 family element, Orf1 [Streptococcus oralis]